MRPWRRISKRPELGCLAQGLHLATARWHLAAYCIAAVLGVAAVPVSAETDNPFGDTRASDLDKTAPYDPGESVDDVPETERLPDAPGFNRERFVKFGESVDGAGYAYFIDPQSLSVQRNEVRYAVLIESRQGATTAYYEGIDCPDDRYRIYAYGNADATQFKPMRKPVWRSAREVTSTAITGFRKLLINDYLCDPVRPRNVAEIRHRLRRGYKGAGR